MPTKKKAKVSLPRPKPDKALRKLEKDIVKRQGKMSEADFEAEERKVLQGRHKDSAKLGMGIDEEEDSGQEPYPEIEEALKDPDEEDEDKL